MKVNIELFYTYHQEVIRSICIISKRLRYSYIL